MRKNYLDVYKFMEDYNKFEESVHEELYMKKYQKCDTFAAAEEKRLAMAQYTDAPFEQSKIYHIGNWWYVLPLSYHAVKNMIAELYNNYEYGKNFNAMVPGIEKMHEKREGRLWDTLVFRKA